MNVAKTLIDGFANEAKNLLEHLMEYERDPFTRDREFNELLHTCRRSKDSESSDDVDPDQLDPATSLHSDERLADTFIEQLDKYWSVAKKRYLDYTCLILRPEIVDATANELLCSLQSSVGKTETLEKMFAEELLHKDGLHACVVSTYVLFPQV